jgi:hypothetical protein
MGFLMMRFGKFLFILPSITYSSKLLVICVFRTKVAMLMPLEVFQQPLEKIHVYIREMCNSLYFRNLSLFNFFSEYVERGTVNSNDKVVAMYLVYRSLLQKPKSHFHLFPKPTHYGIKSD